MSFNETIESRMSGQGRKWLDKSRRNRSTTIELEAVRDVMAVSLPQWYVTRLVRRCKIGALVWWWKRITPINRRLTQHLAAVDKLVRHNQRPAHDSLMWEKLTPMRKETQQ